jgi:REP element-mobilizing transposase RayT
MILNEHGCFVEECWLDLVKHYQNIQLDAHIVMPNHFHGIIQVTDGPRNHGLSEFVRALKTFSARRINESRNTIGKNIWQYGYYDNIIRNDGSLQRIRTYILTNPENWKHDRFYVVDAKM